MARTLLMTAAILLIHAHAAFPQKAALPRVRIVATGGTIAGEQREPGTLGAYEIKKPIREIASMVPFLDRYADVEMEQFSNISSPSVTPDMWLRLSRRINELFRDHPDLSGIVVTHGTGRLEETAFFLHLTVKSDKPVVVVGAQRPPTGISPDGPLNLLQAIRTAGALESRNRGVMIVMDDRIMSARDTVKVYARNGGFEAQEMGMLGVVASHGVEFFYTPSRKHTLSSEFDVSQIDTLPAVGISYSFSGAPGLSDPRDKAIVVATTGLGPEERRHYDDLMRRGTIVAMTFPSGEQINSPVVPPPASPNLVMPINVPHLHPLKARILMMLALSKTSSPAEIQRIFNSY